MIVRVFLTENCLKLLSFIVEPKGFIYINRKIACTQNAQQFKTVIQFSSKCTLGTLIKTNNNITVYNSGKKIHVRRQKKMKKS